MNTHAPTTAPAPNAAANLAVVWERRARAAREDLFHAAAAPALFKPDFVEQRQVETTTPRSGRPRTGRASGRDQLESRVGRVLPRRRHTASPEEAPREGHPVGGEGHRRRLLRLAPPPAPPHDCRRDLPWSNGGYGSTGVAERTIALCPTCGRAWVCLPCYESLGPTTWWRPVRWFSRRAFRQRAAALRLSPAKGADDA